MKIAFFMLCLVVVSCDQDGTFTRPPPDATRLPYTRPPPDDTRLDTRENNASMCGTQDDTRMCGEGEFCIARRVSEDSIINECVRQRLPEDGDCMRRTFVRVEGNEDDDREGEKVVNDREFTRRRVDRERADGARGRDTARTINGAEERPPCERDLRCMSDVCMRPDTEPLCFMRRRNDSDQVRCMDDGMFEPLQCRRISGERDDQRPTALDCHCARPTDGQMIANTMTRVMRGEDFPDCESRSYRSCDVMRDGRMVSLRHDEVVPMRTDDNRCQRCECEDGELQCQDRRDNPDRCSRSNPTDRPASCMMDGEEVPHRGTRQEGNCNMCGCRNGVVTCTRVRDCRGEDDDAGSDSDRDSEDRQCDECMNMPSGPMCAMRDGRTFPTRCHAMRCQGFEMADLVNGACSNRNPCTEDTPCPENFLCMRRGGETKMSSETDRPDNRRLCVNRQALRCLPTEVESDGGRRIRDDEDDILEELEDDDDEEDDENTDENSRDDDDDDDDDRTVCASDRNTYPSTCHMMIEARGDMIPRVLHPGRCRRMATDMERRMRMVCATNGVTYDDERTMRTVGGNVRVDYTGRCDDNEDDTPDSRCKRMKENKRCPRLTNCTRRVMPEDGCCPVCGSTVIMALDQEAIDEHVRITGDDFNVDDFMGAFFRRNGDREPVISDMAPMRCDISMTRPTTTPGETAEVLFKAKDMVMDAPYCHQQAVRMMMKLNDGQTAVTTEQSFVAAVIVAPEAVIDELSGAPAVVASIVMLCGALLAALFV